MAGKENYTYSPREVVGPSSSEEEPGREWARADEYEETSRM